MPEGAEVVVIGTIYKDMKLKPSILDEYVKVRPAHSLPFLWEPHCLFGDGTVLTASVLGRAQNLAWD